MRRLSLVNSSIKVKHLSFLPVGTSVKYEVVGPNLVGLSYYMRLSILTTVTLARPFGGHLQTSSSPDACRPIAT